MEQSDSVSKGTFWVTDTDCQYYSVTVLPMNKFFKANVLK